MQIEWKEKGGAGEKPGLGMLRGAACPCLRQDRRKSPLSPFIQVFRLVLGLLRWVCASQASVLARSRDFCFTIPEGAFPTQPPAGPSGSHPAGKKDIFNRFEPLPPRTGVRNHFSESFIGILHRKHAARFGSSSRCRFCWAGPGCVWLSAPQGAARGLPGSFSPAPAGKDRTEQSPQEGTIPHRQGEPGPSDPAVLSSPFLLFTLPAPKLE